MIRPLEITRRKLRVTLALLALAGGLGIALAAAPAPAVKSIKVGDFAVLVASRLAAAVPGQPSLSPESAAALLLRAGVKIPSDLAAPMTEGEAARIFAQLNISLSPKDPAGILDPDQAAALVGIFGSTLSARGSALQGPVSDSKGSAAEASSSAVRSSLLDSIEDCQALPKTQDCQFCCRSFLGGDNNDSHTNRVCAKACNTKARNVSASEPTP